MNLSSLGSAAKQVITYSLLLAMLGGGVGLFAMQARGAKFMSVQSGSMVPLLHRGDLVITEHVSDAQLQVGDVVTFINPHNQRQTITHRIVERPSSATQGRYVTKGDANPAADAPIEPRAILGKTTQHVARLGYAVDFVRKPIGLALFIYLPALLVILHELRRLAAYYRTQQPYRLPGRRGEHITPNGNPLKAAAATANSAGKMGIVLLIALMVLTLPAHAALQATATLSNSTISTLATPPPIANGILLKNVVLRCHADNIASASRRPKMILYNPTSRDIVATGWHIDDNSGRMVTLPPNTRFKPKHIYAITPLLRSTGLFGLQYEGDRVVLRNASGAIVDGVSWGSDATIFSPAIESLAEGSRIRRVPKKTDNNTANDWKVIHHNCHPPSEEDSVSPTEPVQPDSFTIQDSGLATDE